MNHKNKCQSSFVNKISQVTILLEEPGSLVKSCEPDLHNNGGKCLHMLFPI